MAVNNKTIAKNTMMLYVRMFLVIAIQLYTVPVILRVLGVEDYGIYNVVCGVVTMFSFINGSLASGTQRFFAYSMGKRDKEGLKKVFSANITVYGMFCIVAFVVLEGFCVWFLNNKMTIPADRLWVANWILQFSIFQFMLSLMTTTYNAAIIAHEKMDIYAYFSIFECVAKLAIVYMLQISPWDYLLTYAVLQLILGVVMQAANQGYCMIYFEECRRYRFEWDKPLIRSLLGYAGYNVIGSVAGMLSNYGVNIVQNIFFGPVLNAAHSVASNISGTINGFATNVRMAVRPQIVKSYAAQEYSEMWKLMFQSGKLTFFLFVFISVPLMVELPYILEIWLKTVPDHTVAISRLMVVSILIEILTAPMVAVFQAANKQKHVQLYSSAILLLAVPVSYGILHFYQNVLLSYIVYIVLSALAGISRIIIAKYDLGLRMRDFVSEVVIKCIIAVVIPTAIIFPLASHFDQSLLRLIMTCITSVIVSAIVIWTMGLDRQEKDFVIRYIRKKILRKEE